MIISLSCCAASLCSSWIHIAEHMKLWAANPPCKVASASTMYSHSSKRVILRVKKRTVVEKSLFGLLLPLWLFFNLPATDTKLKCLSSFREEWHLNQCSELCHKEHNNRRCVQYMRHASNTWDTIPLFSACAEFIPLGSVSPAWQAVTSSPFISTWICTIPFSSKSCTTFGKSRAKAHKENKPVISPWILKKIYAPTGMKVYKTLRIR